MRVLGRIPLFCFVVLATSMLIFSCDKDVGNLPAPIPPGSVSCDTISYTEDIAPIISANCSISGCHVPPNPAAGVLLDSYELLKAKGEAGRIEERVINENPTRMPPAGLTQTEKKLIECWLNNGYKP